MSIESIAPRIGNKGHYESEKKQHYQNFDKELNHNLIANYTPFFKIQKDVYINNDVSEKISFFGTKSLLILFEYIRIYFDIFI